MSQYLVSEEAQADVAALWERIAEDRPRAADRMLAALRKVFQHLADYPAVGHAAEGDHADPPRRLYPVKRYGITVVFRQIDGVTLIHRVAGRGRDLGALLGD